MVAHPGSPQEVVVRKLPTGTVLHAVTHDGTVRHLVLSADALTLVVGHDEPCHSGEGRVSVWDLTHGSHCQQSVPFKGAITAMALAHDASCLVVAAKKVVHIFDFAERMLHNGRRVETHTWSVNAVAVGICTNGPVIVSGQWDHIRAWDKFGAHLCTVQTVATLVSVTVSPRDKIVASSSDNKVRVWDVATGSLVSVFGDFWPRSKRLLLVGTPTTGNWFVVHTTRQTNRCNLTTGAVLQTISHSFERQPPSASSRVLSADCSALAVFDEQALNVWSVSEGRALCHLPHFVFNKETHECRFGPPFMALGTVITGAKMSHSLHKLLLSAGAKRGQPSLVNSGPSKSAPATQEDCNKGRPNAPKRKPKSKLGTNPKSKKTPAPKRTLPPKCNSRPLRHFPLSMYPPMYASSFTSVAMSALPPGAVPPPLRAIPNFLPIPSPFVPDQELNLQSHPQPCHRPSKRIPIKDPRTGEEVRATTPVPSKSIPIKDPRIGEEVGATTPVSVRLGKGTQLGSDADEKVLRREDNALVNLLLGKPRPAPAKVKGGFEIYLDSLQSTGDGKLVSARDVRAH